jgi:prepilin peptidase CpaA
LTTLYGIRSEVLSIVWVLFVAITLASAIIDVASYRIPNSLVLALIALFFAVALSHCNEVDWLSHLGAGTIVLGGGIVLYGIGQMGAGDVKLLSALALWAGMFPLVPLLFFISLCGLFGMLVIVLLRMLVPRFLASTPDKRALPRVLTKGQGIPYAVGIGPGAVIGSFDFAPWLWQF